MNAHRLQYHASAYLMEGRKERKKERRSRGPLYYLQQCSRVWVEDRRRRRRRRRGSTTHRWNGMRQMHCCSRVGDRCLFEGLDRADRSLFLFLFFFLFKSSSSPSSLSCTCTWRLTSRCDERQIHSTVSSFFFSLFFFFSLCLCSIHECVCDL